MILDYIRLYNFRNYSSFELYPNKGITVIYGKNGSGKTNLLEAVHFSCFARSHRTRQDKDLIKMGENSSAVEIMTSRKDGTHQLTLQIHQKNGTYKLAYSYGYKLPKISDAYGNCSCVLFSPEDMNIIKGGPFERRKFMDMQISQMNKKYLDYLSLFQNALRNRNALLKYSLQYNSAEKNTKQFDIWENMMSKYASYVICERTKFLEKLKLKASEVYSNISAKSGEVFTFEYENSLKNSENEEYLSILKRNRNLDLRRGSTILGPHKDDIKFLINGQNMNTYASQGQIRTAVLALKLAMIDIIYEYMGEKPILLLDDVFSELDTLRRSALIGYISNIQSFITCTDISDLQDTKVDDYIHVINENGNLNIEQK